MKSLFALTLVIIGAATGCDRSNNTTTTDPAKLVNVAPDNSKKNERDVDSKTLTPGDQGENDLDRGITQKFRQAVVKDDTLSMTAKNIKIITVNGVVTLRGPVKSTQEKNEIAGLATGVDGIKRVDNQLEVAAN